VTSNTHLKLHADVRAALADGQPVVALESTIIAHGMPYPQNVETARRVESIIRQQGAVPATIAILNGQLVVGLTKQELEAVGHGREFLKVSRRDLPVVVAKKLSGATTVAATMFIASLAGIRVFVTGGIGGVHRGAPQTLDISADLLELATTDVAVVSAGAKAILDIGLTLEFLETHGVPVVGYRTDDFPAFYSRSSGFGVDFRVESPGELAGILRAKWDLGLRGGVVIANPIPAEHALAAEVVDKAIQTALSEANEQQISGKAITPFLLARIERITGGASLAANVELVCNNAALGAQLAVEFAELNAS